jgi:hypothetical protein
MRETNKIKEKWRGEGRTIGRYTAAEAGTELPPCHCVEDDI